MSTTVPICPKASNAKLVLYLILAGVLMLIGIALVKGVPPNQLLGVRTAYTFSSTEAWFAVNRGTGALIAMISFVAFYGIAVNPRRIMNAYALFLVTIFVVAVIGSIWPRIPANLWRGSVELSVGWPEHVRLMLSLGVQLVVGATGILLWHERIRPNRWIGFRRYRSDPAAWYASGRAGGQVLGVGTSLSLVILAALLFHSPGTRTLHLASTILLCVTAAISVLSARNAVSTLRAHHEL